MAERSGQNYRFDLGYDGAGFSGSQRQPGRRTVQGDLEAALERLTGYPVKLALAGRTDRGVHAVGQVASGWLRWSRSDSELRRGLAALTAGDLVIYGVRRVEPEFHARFGAISREYRYRVWAGGEPSLLLRKSVWEVFKPLDLAVMSAAAEALIGRQDFSSLAGSGRGVSTSRHDCIRRVEFAEWRRLEQWIEPAGWIAQFRIRADGFLPQMVRNAVGCLVEVGRGRRPVNWIHDVLAARDRRVAAPPAPAHGLILWRVSYDGDGAESVDTAEAPNAAGSKG